MTTPNSRAPRSDNCQRPAISRSRFHRITARALGDGFPPDQLADLLKLNVRTVQRLGRPSHPIRADMLEFYANTAEAAGQEGNPNGFRLAEIYRAEIERMGGQEN